MKKVLITYHMTRGSETAETCITLPMDNGVADGLIDKQGDWIGLSSYGNLRVALECISAMHGYQFGEFICAEEVVDK